MSRDEAERVALFCAGGAVLGAWLGALPIPLDWDRHWQTWPITPAVGAVAAASLALPLAALVSAARPFAGGASRRKRE
jgi:phosphatidylinositol glycan class F